MSEFDDIFAEAALPVLLQTQGERVVYRPREGRPRTIWALVNRLPPEAVEGTSAPTLKFILTVAADSNYPVYGGISGSEIDSGGDKIELAMRDGLAPSPRAFTVSPDDNHGTLKLLIR